MYFDLFREDRIKFCVLNGTLYFRLAHKEDYYSRNHHGDHKMHRSLHPRDEESYFDLQSLILILNLPL